MSWFGKPDLTTQVERLTKRADAAEKAHADLLAAFNKFFDVVAADLGYEAAEAFVYYGHGYSDMLTTSPRLLAENVTPETRTIKRNPTARCVDKKRKGAA